MNHEFQETRHTKSSFSQLAARSSQLLRDWLFLPVSAYPIAIVRIAVGVFLLIRFLPFAPHVPMMFSDAGPVVSSLSPAVSVAWTLYITLIIGSVCITAGIFTRVASGVTSLLLFYYWFLTDMQYPSVTKALAIFFCFLFLFAETDATLSLRAWLRHGTFVYRTHVVPYAQRILMLQLTAIYLTSGLLKAVAPAWERGEILPYSFTGLAATPLAFWLVQQNLPLPVYDIIVFAVRTGEILLAIGLWVPRAQKWAMLSGILFHLLNGLLLGFWSFLLLPFLYPLFLPDAVVERIRARLCGKKALATRPAV